MWRIVLVHRAPPVKLTRCEPVPKELDEQAELLGLVAIHLNTDAHQRLREFAEGVAPGPVAADESHPHQFADLLGGRLLGH